VGIRPEEVAIGTVFPDNTPCLEMTVAFVEFSDSTTWVTCVRDGVRLTGRWQNGAPPREGQKVVAQVMWQRAYLFDGLTGRTLEVPAG
jgi:hypothetical protein